MRFVDIESDAVTEVIGRRAFRSSSSTYLLLSFLFALVTGGKSSELLS